jgi:hypothetical protein
LRSRPQPASRRPSRGRLHGTQHDLHRNRDHLRGGAALERSIRSLHHRQMVPGERATRLWAFERRRSPCLHHLDSKFSSVSSFSGSRGAGNEKPLRSVAREGFDQIELWKGVTPFLPRESACTGNPVQSTRRPSSDCRSCLACRRSRLSRRDHRSVKGAVYDRSSWRGQGSIFKNLEEVQAAGALVKANQTATPASSTAKMRRTISSRCGSARALVKLPAKATISPCAIDAMAR